MSAITGMMLSDGHIALRALSINARFIFVQSAKSTKQEYFNLVLNLMKPFVLLVMFLILKNEQIIELILHIVVYLSLQCNFLILLNYDLFDIWME
jgi:hypothetical protein